MSKGIDIYGYMADASATSITFQSPDGDITQPITDSTEGIFSSGIEIERGSVGPYSWYGHYQWTAAGYDTTLTRYANISPSSGNLQNNSGDPNWLGSMLNTTSVLSAQTAISYGFYDAGASKVGSLTNRDQSYVYVSPAYYNWMGNLAQDQTFADAPFSTFALPGAHDAGMFDPTLLNNSLVNSAFVSAITSLLSGAASLPLFTIQWLSVPALLRLIINLAFTQKDTIATMLGLGIRYFDFRPGYCLPPFNSGTLYHQHNFIPGYPYMNFLEDVLTFLKNHPTEIVVVSVNFQGIAYDSMKPSVDVLNQYLTNALTATGTDGADPGNQIVPGNQNDLSSSYSTLLTQKKRIIFLNQVGASDDAKIYDSYKDTTYRTTDVQNIISALDGMLPTDAKTVYTVLQLQATAEGTGGGIFGGIAAMSDASSPILSTKAMFDSQTYPWVVNNVPYNFEKNRTTVLLNDFADNLLTSAAISITKQRLSGG